MNIDFERNTFNYRFKTQKKRQNWLKDTLLSVCGVVLLGCCYLCVNGLLWAIDTLIK